MVTFLLVLTLIQILIRRKFKRETGRSRPGNENKAWKTDMNLTTMTKVWRRL